MQIPAGIQELHALKHVTDTDTIYFLFDDFVDLLKKGKCSGDKVVRKDNIWNEVKLYHYPSVDKQHSKKYLSFESIIRYCFNHVNGNEICRNICKKVTDSLLASKEASRSGTQPKPRRTVLELYQAIVDDKLFDLDYSCDYQSDLKICDLNIPSLYTCHREHFQTPAWDKICLFEWHFGLTHSVVSDDNDKDVQVRWNFFDQCKSSESFSSQLRILCEDLLERNKQRRATASRLTSITCEISGVTHVLQRIEETVSASTESISFGPIRPVCVQCTDKCTCPVTGLHVFIGLTQETANTDFDNMAFLIQRHIREKHNVSVHQIVFLHHGTLDSFKCADSSQQPFNRLQILQAFNRGLLKSSASRIVNNEYWNEELDDADPIQANGANYCEECIKDVRKWVHHPLNCNNFSLVKEWHLFVPLPLQISLFELFINKQSNDRSQDDQLFEKKLKRLYSLLDTGFSTISKVGHPFLHSGSAFYISVLLVNTALHVLVACSMVYWSFKSICNCIYVLNSKTAKS